GKMCRERSVKPPPSTSNPTSATVEIGHAITYVCLLLRRAARGGEGKLAKGAAAGVRRSGSWTLRRSRRYGPRAGCYLSNATASAITATISAAPAADTA